MPSIEQNFKVKVDIGDEKVNDMLSDTCQFAEFNQTTGNGISKAWFTFYVKALSGDKAIYDEAPKKLAKGADFKFQIMSLSDEAQTKKHNHVITHYDMVYSMRGAAYTLTVYTSEKFKSDMVLGNKSRAHEKERLSDIVEAILKENGMTVKWVEKTKSIAEWQVLRQPYTSDYDFLLEEINPRSVTESGVSGFRFFTSDGKEAMWATLGYKAKEKEVDDEMILNVTPKRANQWVTESGSVTHAVIGFDMNTKSPMGELAKEPFKPSYGNLALPKPYDKALSISSSPFFKKEAVKAAATYRQYLEAYAAFPFTVSIRGSNGWDDVPYTLKVKTLHDQGGGEIKGYAADIKHIYSKGEYTVQVVCLRDRGSAL